MKKLALITVLITLFLVNCTKDDMDSCACKQWEECISNQCIIKKNTYHLGNTIFEGAYVYHGFLHNGTCTDTIVFLHSGNDVDFQLWVNRTDDFFPGAGMIVISQDSNLFRLARLPEQYLLCTEKYVVTFECEIEEDQVNMTIFLQDEKSGPFVDTVKTILTR